MIYPTDDNLELTPEQIRLALESDDEELIRLVHTATTHLYYSFRPRADCPDEFDQQESFIADEESKCIILLGGTGSGKTIAAAHKTASFVLENPPPRERCPFWIIGESFDQICQTAWNEKLQYLIPTNEIHSIEWYRSKRKWPYAVLLKHPDKPREVGWVLEFKSYEQGFSGMKAVSIGGYWCNEEIPYHLMFEIQGRCRDYDSPGWADFTPLECRDPEWPEAYNNPPRGWKFYHLNSLKNDALPPDFMPRYLANVPEDMRELRTIGKFTTLAGTVYKEFNRSIHVVEPFRVPRDWWKLRGIDFGFNNPFCCLWVARDHDGHYHVYDEHYETQRLNKYHVEKIGEREWHEGEPYYGVTYTDHDAQERAELDNLGIVCTPANKSINQGIEYVRSLMLVKEDGLPRLTISSRCVNLIRELHSYRWPDGTDKRNPKDVPMDLNNHACDALRYVLFSDKTGNQRIGIGTKRSVAWGGRLGGMFQRRG